MSNIAKNISLVSSTLLFTSALLGLSNSLAFGQPTYPSTATIEQARTKFKAELRSLQNSNMASYVSDRRSLRNNSASKSSKSELPSQKLLDAIKQQTISTNHSQVEYSFFEFDLNNDGNKDAIVYETGSHCGMAMCYFHVFLNTANQYQILWGQNGLPTYNAKIAILKDSNSELVSIAIPVYTLNLSEYDKVKGWTIYRFNGKEYVQKDVVDSINSQTIIDFEKAQRFNLGK